MRWPRSRERGRHAAPARRADVAPALAPDPTAVRLGFSDGSEVPLPSSDPQARLLRTLADAMLREEPA